MGAFQHQGIGCVVCVTVSVSYENGSFCFAYSRCNIRDRTLAVGPVVKYTYQALVVYCYIINLGDCVKLIVGNIGLEISKVYSSPRGAGILHSKGFAFQRGPPKEGKVWAQEDELILGVGCVARKSSPSIVHRTSITLRHGQCISSNFSKISWTRSIEVMIQIMSTAGSVVIFVVMGSALLHFKALLGKWVEQYLVECLFLAMALHQVGGFGVSCGVSCPLLWVVVERVIFGAFGVAGGCGWFGLVGGAEISKD
eukprot:1676669-Ditylum_brightwellii.AAC.1